MCVSVRLVLLRTWGQIVPLVVRDIVSSLLTIVVLFCLTLSTHCSAASP
jgi:hypothetical protein